MLEKKSSDKKVTTLCIVQEPSRILLGLKKKGWGKGRWNGFGGKVEEGEAIEEAAKRELFEETGLTAKELGHRGVLYFEFKDFKPVEIHVFDVTAYEGELAESDEMRPVWFERNDIPFQSMWPSDALWLPLFLDGKRFEGKFLYGDLDTVVDSKLRVVD